METSLRTASAYGFASSLPPLARAAGGERSYACQLACPACGGPVVELRSEYRCTRCRLSVCIGCEMEVAAE